MFMHEMMMGMYKLFCRFGLKENALNWVVTTKVVQVELDVKTLLQRTQEEAVRLVRMNFLRRIHIRG
jgi:hypothetical protein